MNGVMEEKRTRVVELVLSSIRARDLLAGKIAGIGVVAVAQVAVLSASVVAAAALFNASVLPELDWPTLATGLVWFLVGYLLWGSVFAAAASLSTGSEDPQAIMPVVVAILLSYAVAVSTAQQPSAGWTRAATWFPTVAPFAMPGRIASGEVPVWEALAVLAVAAAATAGVVRVAERIYVNSILRVDRRIGWAEALRLRP
jgi:ABC-2 type transport system permease protein